MKWHWSLKFSDMLALCPQLVCSAAEILGVSSHTFAHAESSKLLGSLYWVSFIEQ